MKILLVGNYPLDNQISMLRFAELMQRQLEARGHEVTTIRPTPRLFPHATRLDGIWKWIGYLNKFALFLPELRRAARNADLVHVCDHSNAMYIPWLAGRPHLITCHDVIAIRAARGLEGPPNVGMAGRVFQHLILRCLRQAQRIVCDSDLTSDQLLDLAPETQGRSSVVPIALSFEFRPASPAEIRTELAAAGIGNSPYLIHVGSALPRKNRGHAVRVLAALRREHDVPLRLIFVGAELDEELRALIRDLDLEAHVIGLGGIDNHRLQALYSGAIALIFPSLSEGFGWPVIEAQACGCPAIISDLRPMTDIGGEAAIRIDPLDAAAAARTIAAALPDLPERRLASIRNAALFSAGAMMDGYEAAYRSLR
jgi:glycosyltransferase involved in cell wall biosynthesis